MYYFATWGLMLAIPAVAVLIELMTGSSQDVVWLVAKWFVFWGIGIRMLTAGIRQVAQPAFTARTLFRFEEPGAEKLVSEIGFGNLAMGSVATASLLFPSFTIPLGLAGGLFLALAGIKHVTNADRTIIETTAMITDLIVAIIAIVSVVMLMLR